MKRNYFETVTLLIQEYFLSDTKKASSKPKHM